MRKWFCKKSQSVLTSPEHRDFHQPNLLDKMQGFARVASPWILLISFFGLAFLVKHETTQTQSLSRVSSERQTEILSTLNDQQLAIAHIQADHDPIQEIQASLTRLEHTAATEQSLSGLATAAALQQVSAQLQQLQHTLHPQHSSNFRKKQAHRSTTVRESLPFRVKSIDTIAGQPFASVEYHHTTLPLRLNEDLAGWKAVTLDTATGKAVWENRRYPRRRIVIAASKVFYAE